VGELQEWVHLDAIQALVHHATAVIAAIFIFGITARLITYLIPNGYAKRIVIIVDDVILLAVFILAGWRLLEYMWVRPHLAETPYEEVSVTSPAGEGDGTEALLAECGAGAAAGDEPDRCLEKKNRQAQRALAQAAARMTEDMRALDKVGNVKIGAARNFDAAQQAFMHYRETECRWRSTSARTGAPADIYQACMASLARGRAAQIEEILGK